MKIGVFDSGVGGLSVANAIRGTLPEHEVLLREDTEHVPYGTRPLNEILEFVSPIIQELIDAGCRVIVIACNTVSTNLIVQLRQTFSVAFIAIEPMVKPATALTKTKKIAVFATPNTLSSQRYQQLKTTYAQGVEVIEPDCSDWSYMIENDQINTQKIADQITEVLEAGADVIVLACTHYHWIEQEIKTFAGDRATVLQPEEAIVRQLKKVIAKL